MSPKKKKSSSRSLKSVIEKDMPGWTVAPRGQKAAKKGSAKSAAKKTAKKKTAANRDADAVSPSIAALKTRVSGRETGADAKPKAPTTKAQFVTITTQDRLDAPQGTRKVALVRDGKVVARQG